MKYLLLFLLVIPFAVMAQDCKLITSKDPYTREIKVSTGLISLNSGQYSIEASKAEIDFMFSLSEKCFDDASTASIFFEGTRLKTNFRNSGTMNCDGLFHITFRNTTPSQSAFVNLETRKIGSIRFKDRTGKETGITLSAEQQQILMDFINCIDKESKKLL